MDATNEEIAPIGRVLTAMPESLSNVETGPALSLTLGDEDGPADCLMPLVEDSFSRTSTLSRASFRVVSPRHEQEETEHTEHAKGVSKPWFVWPILCSAVCAVSSAGVVFSSMTEVPSILLAAWRLQLTAVLLAPGAVVQWRQMGSSERKAAFRSSLLLLGSGICLAFHFGCWVWGIAHTSLAHSLLLVSATPVLVAISMVALCKPISIGELAGTTLAVIGAAILCLRQVSGPNPGSGQMHQSWKGDLSSLAGAAAMVGYLAVGGKLRGAEMPLFVYACPVTGTAAIALSAASMIFEKTSIAGVAAGGVFGWAVSYHWWKVLYLATGPGLVGHTGFNFLLSRLSPLVVSLALTLEPLVGSLMGWAAGVSAAPSWSDGLGGFLLMGAMVIVTVSSHKRQLRQNQQNEPPALHDHSRSGIVHEQDEDAVGVANETAALLNQ